MFDAKLKVDLLYSYFCKIITGVVGFGFVYIVNNYASVDVYGKFVVIASTAGIFASLITFRTFEAVTVFWKKEKLKRNLENLKIIFITALTVDFVIALLFILLIYFFSEYISKLFLKNVTFSYAFFLFSFITSIELIKGSFVGILQANEDFFSINTSLMIEGVSKIILLVLMIAEKKSLELRDIIYITLIASLISFIYIFIKSLRELMKVFKYHFNFDRKLLKEFFKYTAKTFTSSTLKAGTTNIDNLILSYYLDTHIVGVYQTIKKIFHPLILVINPIPMILFPRFIAYFETGKGQLIRKNIFSTSLVLLLVFALYDVSIYQLLSKLYEWLNIPYTSVTISYFWWIAFLMLFYALLWWTRIFSSTVDPMLSVYASVMMFSCKLILYPFLVSHVGLYGLFFAEALMGISLGSWWYVKLMKHIERKKLDVA